MGLFWKSYYGKILLDTDKTTEYDLVKMGIDFNQIYSHLEWPFTKFFLRI